VGTNVNINLPYSIVFDANYTYLYVTEHHNNLVRQRSTAGATKVVAGGNPGYADGVGVQAMFNKPAGLTLDSSGNLYVVETGGQRLRKITPSGSVTTLAGSGFQGYADGTGTSASFF
jgi:sugar lactone lactonase YvrE